jgi:deoxyribonuclease-4
MPAAGGLDRAVRRGAAIGCTAVQVFTSSPQQWKAREVTAEQALALREAVDETSVEVLVSHDSYLVNLCAPDAELREKSRRALRAEMERCHALGITLVVSHMGAHLGQGEDAGVRLIAQSTRELLAETPDDVTLLMETTAGQGSSMGSRFETLAAVLEASGAPTRLAVCLDTCHVFAAGYDVSTDEGYDATFAEFDRLIGLDLLRVIHCNDSKKALGSRVDRHAAIGEGEIGEGCFRRLMNDPRWDRVPIVIETPDAETMHEQNLRKLFSYRV